MTEQRDASRRLILKLSKNTFFKRSKHCAFYLPNDGEISSLPLLAVAQKRKKACYLPKLLGDRMQFRHYQPPQKLVVNRYGIPEPDESCVAISPEKLDIVFVPLVAFDSTGNRLGMGGGYYDRAFAFKNRYPGKAPVLVGLAHECQQSTELTINHWDIKLDFIATDKKVIRAVY